MRLATAEAKNRFACLLRQVEEGETIAISKHDQTVAYLIPRARLELLIETMEILGNPSAKQSIHQHDSGQLSFHPLSALDDEG